MIFIQEFNFIDTDMGALQTNITTVRNREMNRKSEDKGCFPARRND